MIFVKASNSAHAVLNAYQIQSFQKRGRRMLNVVTGFSKVGKGFEKLRQFLLSRSQSSTPGTKWTRVR